MVNLKEAWLFEELRNDSLVQENARNYDARYHRWIFEKHKDESVESLRECIIQEAEFQTIVSETVRGLASTVKEETQKATKGIPRAFLGNSENIENRGNSLTT